MEKKLEHCRIQNWYPRLSVYSLPTNFVFLMDIEIQALQNGDTESGIAKGVIDRLASAMSKFPFTRFVGTDLVAPTDTVRFEEKRGAVRSASASNAPGTAPRAASCAGSNSLAIGAELR